MAIHRIKRISISEQVYEQLRKQLLRGEWKPGDKLPSENELAENLGVSRVTVRQAIQKMAALGLLETRLGEGTFVRPFMPDMVMSNIIPLAYLGENTLLEVLEFRKIIEITTTELAVEKVTDEDIRSLEKIYDRMLFVQEDKTAFFQADFDFHLEIAKITRNTLVIKTYSILRDLLEVAMERIVDVRGTKGGIYYHNLLLEAIKSRDSERCRKVMEHHISDTYDSMAEKINEIK